MKRTGKRSCLRSFYRHKTGNIPFFGKVWLYFLFLDAFMIRSLFLFCTLLISLHASPQSKTIVLEMGMGTGYPPYQFMENDHPRGFMFDVLQFVARQEGYRVIGKGFPKKRHELMMERGELDAIPNAKEWIDKPEEYLFSDTVVKARDVIFSLKKNPLPFRKVEDLFGKQGIGILGYSYPPLSKYFIDGIILRHDTTNEFQMLQMLQKYRADFGIVNELVGKWLIKQNGWQNQFLISEKDVGFFNYRYMFSHKWKPFVKKLNEHLQRMNKEGVIKKLIRNYQ